MWHTNINFWKITTQILIDDLVEIPDTAGPGCKLSNWTPELIIEQKTFNIQWWATYCNNKRDVYNLLLFIIGVSFYYHGRFVDENMPINQGGVNVLAARHGQVKVLYSTHQNNPQIFGNNDLW